WGGAGAAGRTGGGVRAPGLSCPGAGYSAHPRVPAHGGFGGGGTGAHRHLPSRGALRLPHAPHTGCHTQQRTGDHTQRHPEWHLRAPASTTRTLQMPYARCTGGHRNWGCSAAAVEGLHDQLLVAAEPRCRRRGRACTPHGPLPPKGTAAPEPERGSGLITDGPEPAAASSHPGPIGSVPV